MAIGYCGKWSATLLVFFFFAINALLYKGLSRLLERVQLVARPGSKLISLLRSRSGKKWLCHHSISLYESFPG